MSQWIIAMGILTSRNGDRGSVALVKKGIFTGILPEVHNLREDFDTLGELSSADSLVIALQKRPSHTGYICTILKRSVTNYN